MDIIAPYAVRGLLCPPPPDAFRHRILYIEIWYLCLEGRCFSIAVGLRTQSETYGQDTYYNIESERP